MQQIGEDDDKENAATKHSSSSAKELKEKDTNKPEECPEGQVKDEEAKEDEKSVQRERALSVKSIPKANNTNNLLGKGKT